MAAILKFNMNQQKASIASNGRTIPIVVSRKHDLQEQQQLQKQQQQQHDQNRLFSRRRSISLVEIDDIKEDPDATPVPRRKAQPQPLRPSMASSRPSSYFFTEGLDKMADDIINSVRSPNVSNVMDEPPLTTALKNQATGLVRRTSSGYSTGSAGSVRVLKSKPNSNEKSSSVSSTRKSIIGLVKRTSTSASGGHTTSSSATASTSPVQSRIASKSSSTSKKKISSNSSGSGSSAQQQQLETSNDKRAQFTQVRSKTGLNIFGGRRRSIAITDDAYNAAMRAAKSHLDLRDAMEQQPPASAGAPASPQTASTNSAIERKKSSKSNKSVETAPGTKSSDVESPPAKKQIFGERPWIELEKLWRGRLKNPPPDLTEDDFLSLTSSSSAASKNQKSKAQTLPVNSRPPRKDSKKQPIPEKWPPQNLQVPRRTISNAGKGDDAGATGISRDVAKKAITLLSEGEVLEDFRQSKSDGCLNKRPHSFALTSAIDGDNHFDELVKIW